MFETEYFDQKAYLSQSGQLYNEATAMAFGKVYCFGPTFRAEKSKTRRHLIEFWMVEPEVAFATLEDIIELGRGPRPVHHGAGPDQAAAPSWRRLERDSRTARGDHEALPAADLRPRPSRSCARRARRSSGAATSARPRRRMHLRALRPRRSPSPTSPTAIKAFYMQPAPENAGRRRSASTSWPRRATARSSAAASASTTWPCSSSASRSTSCRREAYEWYLDLRKYGTRPPRRASAWASSGWSPGSAASSTSARPFPSRGSFTGSIPDPADARRPPAAGAPRERSPSSASAAPRTSSTARSCSAR
ncbi:MAG: hypothetical protein MZV70_66850 [Desulfobacterales bacterium]|nr:hypothetical protein [Desulfobacterales bacterium]